MIPRWLDQPVWRPVSCPLTNGTTDRSPEHLEAIVGLHQVHLAPRYQKSGSLTRCNLYASDICRAMGALLPLQWLKGDRWDEMDANELHAWLLAEGATHGWEKSDAHSAQRVADEGMLGLASWANPTGASGHLSVLMPSRGEVGVWATQAGAVNFERDLLQRGFGGIAPDYWCHS